VVTGLMSSAKRESSHERDAVMAAVDAVMSRGR
jgi:hypothetical protein